MMNFPQAPVPPVSPVPPGQQGGPMTREQELELLKGQARMVQDQLQAINTHIEGIEKGGGGSALVAVVDPGKCTICGACQQVCPAGAIAIEKTAVVDNSRCQGCGLCAEECPQNAIILKKRT